MLDLIWIVSRKRGKCLSVLRKNTATLFVVIWIEKGLFVLKTTVKCLVLLLVSSLFAGCITHHFTVAEPMSSSVEYEVSEENECRLVVKDGRESGDSKFTTGKFKVQLNIHDELEFLKRNLERELEERGVAVERIGDTAPPMTIEVRKFRVRNNVIFYGPWVTYTTFSADITDGAQRHRITGYFKNAKVPVWEMDPITDPCFSTPLSLVVKEAATKINGRVLGYSSPDSEVDRLATELERLGSIKSIYFKVLELGYTNNPKAIPVVMKMTNHTDSMVRPCAVSALGMLQAKDQLDYLIGFYQSHDGTEKYMALKAIGDLNTDQSLAFLKSVMDSEDSEEFDVMEVLKLYI